MYEFRGATLKDAVHQARRYPALSTKKLAKVAAKFDFTARMRIVTTTKRGRPGARTILGHYLTYFNTWRNG